MSRRKQRRLAASRAENRHPAARDPQQVEHVNAVIWDYLHQRESENKLPWLTPQFATACYEAYRRGDHAQIQVLWDQLEEYDETLASVLASRLGAIAEMPWSIAVDADMVGEDAGRQALAEAQQATLTAALARVENLEDALVHLAMADFRGVAALELVETEAGQRWEVIEPWLLARPARRGPWLYNPQAQSNPCRLEGLRPERVILREARPIDLPAMFLIVAKHHAIENWDCVLDVFGVPSIFMELPPATSQEMATYYDGLMQRLVGDGRGTIPNGAKFQTVETRQNTTAPFAERAKWCNEAIITLATGGLLTVSTEAGSGTLAGNAHADSLARLCALTARSITSCINRQWARRVLEAAYPGQPILARFELAPEQEEDTTATVQQLATLASAGWRPSDATVSEMVGYEVAAAPQPVAEMPRVAAPVVNRREGAVEEPPRSARLTEEGALADVERLLADALRPEAIAADAAALSRGMEEALTNSCNQYQHEPGCPQGDSPVSSEDGTASMTHTAWENRPAEPEEPEGGWMDEEEDPYADNPGWDEPEEEEDFSIANKRDMSLTKCGKDNPEDCRLHRTRFPEEAGGAADHTHPGQKKQKAIYDYATTKKKLGEYKRQYKEILPKVEEALGLPPRGNGARVRETTVAAPLQAEGITEAKIYGSSVKEMLNYNAVQSSLVNGVEYPVHVEAVMRTKELVPTAKPVDRYEGRKPQDSTSCVFVLVADFNAQDGQPYRARYTIHKMAEGNGPAKVYFMDCARGW